MLRHALYARVTLRRLCLTRRCSATLPSTRHSLLSVCPYHTRTSRADSDSHASASSCPVMGHTPPLPRCPLERVSADEEEEAAAAAAPPLHGTHTHLRHDDATSHDSHVPRSAQATSPLAVHTHTYSRCPASRATCYTPTLWHMTQIMGKSQLSAYVAATALAGYVLAGGTSLTLATALTVGTLLQSYSANTANQVIEVQYDARMKRTCRRPLPAGHVTRRTAAAIAATELVGGTVLLGLTTGAAVGLLGVVNWLLYVAMYTPLKRVSAVNTWFGSIVGGVPPAMGALAAVLSLSGEGVFGSLLLLHSSTASAAANCAVSASSALAASSTAAASATTAAVSASAILSTSSAALVTALQCPAGLLVALLVIWQVPHFNGLSFHCRRDYEAAGFKMLAFYNPWRASFYAVTLSLLMAALTLLGPSWWIGARAMPVEGVWYYPVVAAVNAVMVYKSVLFHRDPTRHCRGCFVFSYLYLSVMLVVLMLNHLQPVTRMQEALERVRMRGRERGGTVVEEKTGPLVVAATPLLVKSCET